MLTAPPPNVPRGRVAQVQRTRTVYRWPQKKGRGFEMRRIVGRAVDRGHQKLLVVNEGVKKASE